MGRRGRGAGPGHPAVVVGGAASPGVTVPVEYGGLGLAAAHQQAFREEAADYRMPEAFGNAFNVVLPTCWPTATRT